jgi:hypothetical protein
VSELLEYGRKTTFKTTATLTVHKTVTKIRLYYAVFHALSNDVLIAAQARQCQNGKDL